MQTLPKWKCVIRFEDGDEHTVWVYDHWMTGALRKIADLQFTEDGLKNPQSITVSRCGLQVLHSSGTTTYHSSGATTYTT